MKTLFYFSLTCIVLLNISGYSYAQKNTEDRSSKAIRLGLKAGGLNTNPHPALAKNYGPFLLKWGFDTVNKTNYIPKTGDIRVFQPYAGGYPNGFMDGYDGVQWVSYYKEDGFWPNPKYEKYHPVFKIFRRSNKR